MMADIRQFLPVAINFQDSKKSWICLLFQIFES